MKKLTLVAPFALAIPLAALSTNAYSADAKTVMQNLEASGFVDVVYTLSDGTDENNNANNESTEDKKFNVSGELDLMSEINPRTEVPMPTLQYSNKPSWIIRSITI